MECPRCGSNGLEILKTYCHCVNCLYSPDLDEPPSGKSIAEIRAKYPEMFGGDATVIEKDEFEDDDEELLAS